jgi:peptidoglycan L-alanyl-D-glutamate endopeptidase CwlK
MASRSLSDLEANTKIKAERFEILTREAGLPVLIYCTLRPFEEQAILYRQSRPLSEIKKKAQDLSSLYGRVDLARILMDAGPQNGPHVTNAAPGESLHGYGMALDGCPMRAGKPVWGTEAKEDMDLWQIYGELGQAAGLDWAGEWISFKEYPHLQAPGANWRLLI